MSKIKMYKQLSNLDMVTTYNVKKRSFSKSNITVFVNSKLFLTNSYYLLQIEDVKYAIDGMLEKVWFLIKIKKYSAANKILNKILKYSNKSSKAYFYKFIVSLYLKTDAYAYLKQAIENKNDTFIDDYYRLYLRLYMEFLDISDDYELQLETLTPATEIVAFNKNSYNGKYLEFLKKIELSEFNEALKYLKKCIDMKPDDIYLEIANYLVEKIIEHKKNIAIEKDKQDRELEKIRCHKFAEAIKQMDISRAKKELKTILNYRNLEGKNNYIYYQFLEVIEMIEMLESDLTFEIMPVTYNYLNENDLFYTFNEAIGIGDFKKACEIGKKCRGKSLDKNQPIIKVNLYILLLEYFYKRIEERQKEMDNIYLIIQNNILRGQFKHALELYEANSDYLTNYKQELIYDLFNQAILYETNEIKYRDYSDNEELARYDISEEELDDIPIEVIMQDSEDDDTTIEEQLQLYNLKADIEKELALEVETKKNKEKIVEVTDELLEVKPLLTHVEPQAEYFVKYKECLDNGNYEEARMWLNNFDKLLKDNNLRKRLDYYYYLIDLIIYEANLDKNLVNRKKDIYALAYNSMLKENYEQAISYLNYYIEIDNNINIAGYILSGRIFTLMGNYNLAIENYIRANSIFPNPDAYYFLGELYYKKHKWNEAIFCYLAYNEFYPKENPTVYINLSECYRRVGKTAKVVKYLKIAEEINVEQKKGLYLKNRILKAEMVDKKRKEHFYLQRKSQNENLVISNND